MEMGSSHLRLPTGDASWASIGRARLTTHPARNAPLRRLPHIRVPSLHSDRATPSSSHPCPNMHVRTRADTPRSQSLSSCEAIYPNGLLSWRPLATLWSARRPSTLFGTRRSAKRDPSEGTPPLAHPRYRFTCDYTSFSLSRPSSPITPDVSWPSAVSNRTLHIRQ